ncbi:hypothetical protein [Georgenia muralis]|uniref:Uncharacterized protein n=1 Tax=Georgenia muralis TaxID=154117 RepID=A0A3N4ZA78_9MICO|nr:hypothetical protein [Georgenia muralis]RPF29023.1 hypothetical protein EDD32_3575 [Georgenia muralis]
MSKIDAQHLAAMASQNIRTADAVRRDPAVVKAARQFAEDGAQTIRSGTELALEVRSSWRRHSD